MKADDLGLRLLTAAVAAGSALGLAHILQITALHVPIDPNEGWNAYFTHAATATGSPYPPDGGTMLNNYPPLSFYLIGALARLFGDPIVTGRVVALMSLAAVAGGIFAAARRMGCGAWEAALAALYFPAVVMATTDYAGMDDPQMLGHAIAIGGLVLVLAEPQTPRAMVGAALLFTLALFVKHNLIVLPAAIALWLFLLDRRLAGTFVGSGIVFLLIGLGLFKQHFGFSLWHQVASARTYSLESIRTLLAPWLSWSFAPLAATALLFVVARRDRHAMLCAIYAAAGTAAGIYFLGGAGVDANALFDADIALALSIGVLANRIAPGPRSAAVAFVYAPLFVLVAFGADMDWRSWDYWRHPAAAERATAAQEIALVRDAKGPVICEMLSLCYWAGKPAEIDVFNLGQAMQTGARSDKGFVRDIDGKRYALIELEAGEPFPFTPAVRAALARSYHVARDDDERTFYAPNRAP